MNKTELINSLSEETTFNKKDLARVLDTFARILMRTLKKGDKLQLSGIGTFSVAKRAARNGINPATKERIRLEESKYTKFRAGKQLKESIRSSR